MEAETTILERIARLETYVEVIINRLDAISAHEVKVMFVAISGLAAIAFLVLKNKDK